MVPAAAVPAAAVPAAPPPTALSITLVTWPGFTITGETTVALGQWQYGAKHAAVIWAKKNSNSKAK